MIGAEFVNFISAVAICRIVRKARQAGMLDKMTYDDLIDDLSSAQWMTDALANPKSDDGYWVHTLQCIFEKMEVLGLLEPAPKPEPKKQGRKPKPKDSDFELKRSRRRLRKDANQFVGKP